MIPHGICISGLDLYLFLMLYSTVIWPFFRKDGIKMRKTIALTQWEFRFAQDEGKAWEPVTVPHTWNALDGQAGGGYRRTRGIYRICFPRPEEKQVYVRFEGANTVAEATLNGQRIGRHVGGYSAFQFDLTDALVPGMNTLCVEVSNEPDANIYPAFADYTFFGGMYRKAELLCFDGPHFSLKKHGSEGVFVTPSPDGQIRVQAYTEGGRLVRACVTAPDGSPAAQAEVPVRGDEADLSLKVEKPQPWEGVPAPRLYRLRIALDDADEMDIRFGFRTAAADAERGFLLNGAPYPLHGVSRHQDRENMGWALSPAQHLEDMDIIREIGANTVRLPHYQQDEYVLDLCDERGLVVWAEAPMNSEYLPGEEADRLLEAQLTEMICQQYNHVSICFWSIANEISIGGVSEALFNELRHLNAIVKDLDSARLTVMANMGSVSPESPLWAMTDFVSVNQYLGWYDGSREDYGPFLDRLHAALKGKPLALSEYGAEAVTKWHSDDPKCMDYTEEYQALVHESAWAAIAARPWLVGSWVWNMFDFAACHRNEGGVPGRNNKGLVTYDRKTRKDAFWFYKACWSREPFVYITGKRFTRRAGDSADVKVYSNLSPVTLSDGKTAWTLEGEKVFIFRAVPLAEGETTLTARAGACADTLTLTRLDAPDPAYVMPQAKVELDSRVRQWFADLREPREEIVHREGYFSMDHMMDDIVRSPEAMEAVEKYWAGPLELASPTDAARLRKGGSMPPATIWRYVKDHLPEAAYSLLDAALSRVKCEE